MPKTKQKTNKSKEINKDDSSENEEEIDIKELEINNLIDLLNRHNNIYNVLLILIFRQVANRHDPRGTLTPETLKRAFNFYYQIQRQNHDFGAQNFENSDFHRSTQGHSYSVPTMFGGSETSSMTVLGYSSLQKIA